MSGYASEHGLGGRLRHHRIRLALWIAAAEGLVVWLTRDLTKWSVAALAIVAVLLWFLGRERDSNFLREVLWIFAASQLLALLLVLLAVVVKWALVVGLVVFAVGGLVYLLLDHR